MDQFPRDLDGEHTDPHDEVPTWWPKYGPLAVSVLVIAGVTWRAVRSEWLPAALLAVMGLAGVVMLFRTRSRRPAATVLNGERASVVVHGRPPRVVPWTQVRGIRVFTRRVVPQLLLHDGSALSLPGLSRDQAEHLAQWLVEVGHRDVTLDVDGRPITR